MTNGQRRHTVSIMILIVGGFLALAIWMLGPRIFADVAVNYDAAQYQPEQASYCPGDTLRFQYTLVRERPGPVQIIRAWCRVGDGICSLPQSVVEYAVVARVYPPLSVTGTRPIPTAEARMTAGTKWEYINAVVSLDGSGTDWYSVPFTIAADCPTP